MMDDVHSRCVQWCSVTQKLRLRREKQAGRGSGALKHLFTSSAQVPPQILGARDLGGRCSTDKGNCPPLMFVGPAPGLPRKRCFHIYQGQNESTKPQCMGSISPQAHIGHLLYERKEPKRSILEKIRKRKTLPWFP